jgi:hypothetical protein
MTPTSVLLYMWAATPYKTIHDVRTATAPPKYGATGTGNTSYYLPKLLEQQNILVTFPPESEVQDLR